MNKSETIGELAKALCKVQSSLIPARKNSTNPFFGKNYADLESIWDACREALTNNGFAVSQVFHAADHGVVIETILIHASGEFISGEMFLPLAKQDAQGVGSAATYGRRYGLAAIVGVVTEDDDGNSASGKSESRQGKQKQTPKATQPPRQDAKQPTPLKQRIDNAIMAIEAFQVRAIPRAKGQSDEEYFAALETQYKEIVKPKVEAETTDEPVKRIKAQQLTSLEKLCPMKGVEPSDVASKYSHGRTDKLSELYEDEAGTALKEVSAIKE